MVEVHGIIIQRHQDLVLVILREIVHHLHLILVVLKLLNYIGINRIHQMKNLLILVQVQQVLEQIIYSLQEERHLVVVENVKLVQLNDGILKEVLVLFDEVMVDQIFFVMLEV